jgi:hypothetical protein
LSKEGLEKIAEKVNPFWKDVFFEFIRVETGKGGVGGYSTCLENNNPCMYFLFPFTMHA